MYPGRASFNSNSLPGKTQCYPLSGVPAIAKDRGIGAPPSWAVPSGEVQSDGSQFRGGEGLTAQGAENPVGGRLARADRVGNSDPRIKIPRGKEPRVFFQLGGYFFEKLQVADGKLGHRGRPAINAVEEGR